MQAQGRLYMHLARLAVDRFGHDGERSVRLGLRAYGHWRGTEMREAHHALGHPINMKTLSTCWDNASTYVDKDSIAEDGRFDDFDSEFNVHYCPAAEAWKSGNFHQMVIGTATSSTKRRREPIIRTVTSPFTKT